MTPDWSIGQPTEADKKLLAQPFDAELLSLVTSGEDSATTWELFDSFHPRLEDPNAVGHRFVVQRERGGSDSGGVRSLVGSDEVAAVGGRASRREGHLIAQCNKVVSSASVTFDDGSVEHILAVASATTGQHWVVCSLDSDRVPIRIDLQNTDAQVVYSQHVKDPRQFRP